MWAVKEREASLRRRLTEHYASILTWESSRLQTALRSAASTPQPYPPSQTTPSMLDRSNSSSSKGKGRETKLDAEVERLNARVRELEDLVGDAGEREAVVQAELKTVQRHFESHRGQVEEHRGSLEREIETLQGHLRSAEEKHAHYRSREEDSRMQDVEGVRSILAPLLDRASPPDDETLEDLALVVRDAFEGLEAEVRVLKGEIKETRDAHDLERARLEEDAEKSSQDHLAKERKWEDERGGFVRQVKELCVPALTACSESRSLLTTAPVLQIDPTSASEIDGRLFDTRACHRQRHAVAPLEPATLDVYPDPKLCSVQRIILIGQSGRSTAGRRL
jgi:hypothetical protein